MLCSGYRNQFRAVGAFLLLQMPGVVTGWWSLAERFSAGDVMTVSDILLWIFVVRSPLSLRTAHLNIMECLGLV
jgi:hypothetical protein